MQCGKGRNDIVLEITCDKFIKSPVAKIHGQIYLVLQSAATSRVKPIHLISVKILNARKNRIIYVDLRFFGNLHVKRMSLSFT